MAVETGKAKRNRIGGRAGDAIVMMAMALVTLALCFGLVLQAGLGFWLAATVSLSFYLGLLTLHAILRRSGQMDELRREVEHLKSTISRMDGAQSDDLRPLPMGSEPAPRKNERALSGSAEPALYAPVSPQSVGGPSFGSAMPAPSSPPPAPAVPTLATPPPHAPPSQAGPGRGDPRTAPASGAAPAVTPDGGSTTELMARMQRVVRGAPPPAPAPAPVQSSSSMRVIPSSPPLRTPSPAMAPPPPAEPQFDAMPAAVPHAPPSLPETPVATEAVAPRDVAASAVAPREADVEMIHGLIKKLADEVNAADAAKLAAPVAEPPAIVEERTVADPVGALKRVAATMKEPAHAPTLDEEVADAIRAKRTAGSQQPAQQAAQPPLPAASTATGPEPEFDLETLMRRAQPIATMDGGPRAAAPVTDMSLDQRDDDALLGEGNDAVEAPEAAELGAIPPQDDVVVIGPDAALDEASRLAMDDLGAVAGDAFDSADAARAAEAERRLEDIAAALDAGRVDVFLEPILDLARKQPSHFEVTVRLRDEAGTELAGLASVGDDADMLVTPLLDSIRFSRTAQVAQLLEERGKSGAVFSTFAAPSLASDDFLANFADTFEAQQGLAAQLVLTFAQSDVRRFGAQHWQMIEEMRDLGFRFAVRAVTDLDMDFEPLVAAGFAFVKLDADVFLEGLPAPGDVVPAADICKHLAGHGLSLVVEHIDDEAKRARVFGFGVLLGQGQLFGGPRLMKASALATPSKAA